MICNRNHLAIRGRRRGHLLPSSLLATKFLSFMLTFPYSRSIIALLEYRKKKVYLVIRSSFNLIRCGGIGGIKYAKPDKLPVVIRLGE